MSRKVWKALIVDDERLARAKLRALLSAFPNIEITGEADSVAQAVQVIGKTNPDVIFLDIQMPQASGFDLLENNEIDAKVIFVTAYDEYAIRAFEVNALDYLLKPVNPARLARAVERLGQPIAEITGKNLEYDDFIFVNSGRNSKFIKVGSIKCILAADVYTEILTHDNTKYLFSRPLSDWEGRLPAKSFLRIHRSTIINVRYVERVEKLFNYSYQITLRDTGEPFVASRRYAARIKDKFN